MSARRLLLLVTLAATAGCSKTSSRPGLHLAGPSAVAVFHGLSSRDAAALHPYLAVADERGDDLRIIDAIDGKAVLAPGLILALTVPTAPRPALLASGQLGDGGADLLVVAPVGLVACDPAAPTTLGGCIQVVATWDPALKLDPALRLDLGALGAADAEILTMAIIPVPEVATAGGWQATAGQARVVAGLSGGRLLMADFGRDPAGTGLVQLAAAIHDLGFDAVSISGSPGLGALYAASPDPIGGIEGVAKIDVSGPVVQAPPVQAIPVGAPTTVVLAATVRPFLTLGETSINDVHGDPVERVYAAIEPDRCGRDKVLLCGLAVLDPVAMAPLPDPAIPAQLPMHRPIEVPGTVLGLVAVYPPSVGGLNLDGTTAPPGTEAALQVQATVLGARYVSTLAAATSSNGAVILVDLARGALALDRDVLSTISTTTGAGVGQVSTSKPPVEGQPTLALWDSPPPPASPVLSTEQTVMPDLVTMTPGYATTEGWSLVWQGILTDLSARVSQLQLNADGTGPAWLAVQSSSGAGAVSGPFRGVERLYDPRLGIHLGDSVTFAPDDLASCPLGAFELVVTSLLEPTADAPGGALQVTPATVQPTVIVTETVNGVPTQVTRSADPTCLNAAPAPGRATGRATVRAAGLVLTGSTFGYAGRPEIQATGTEPRFEVPRQDAATLACSLLDDPTWPPAALGPTDRDQCEQLYLARKGRRAFYLAERCLAADTLCVKRWGTGDLVNPIGPVLAFKVGWKYPTADTSVAPARGTVMSIPTAVGLVEVSRRPQVGTTITASVLPAGMTTFDKAGATLNAGDGVRIYTAYPGGLVFDTSPSASQAGGGVLR